MDIVKRIAQAEIVAVRQLAVDVGSDGNYNMWFEVNGLEMFHPLEITFNMKPYKCNKINKDCSCQ